MVVNVYLRKQIPSLTILIRLQYPELSITVICFFCNWKTWSVIRVLARSDNLVAFRKYHSYYKLESMNNKNLIETIYVLFSKWYTAGLKICLSFNCFDLTLRYIREQTFNFWGRGRGSIRYYEKSAMKNKIKLYNTCIVLILMVVALALQWKRFIYRMCLSRRLITHKWSNKRNFFQAFNWRKNIPCFFLIHVDIRKKQNFI